MLSPPDEGMMAASGSYAGYSVGSHELQMSDISSYVEIWDYAGGCNFRGFVAGDGEEKALFCFFGPSVIGKDLKKA
jgi:hypothetical protein